MAKEHQKNLKSKNVKKISDFQLRCDESKTELGDNFTFIKWIASLHVKVMHDFNCLEAIDVLKNQKESCTYYHSLCDTGFPTRYLEGLIFDHQFLCSITTTLSFLIPPLPQLKHESD